jgi:hypothetical protein
MYTMHVGRRENSSNARPEAEVKSARTEYRPGLSAALPLPLGAVAAAVIAAAAAAAVKKLYDGCSRSEVAAPPPSSARPKCRAPTISAGTGTHAHPTLGSNSCFELKPPPPTRSRAQLRRDPPIPPSGCQTALPFNLSQPRYMAAGKCVGVYMCVRDVTLTWRP